MFNLIENFAWISRISITFMCMFYQHEYIKRQHAHKDVASKSADAVGVTIQVDIAKAIFL